MMIALKLMIIVFVSAGFSSAAGAMEISGKLVQGGFIKGRVGPNVTVRYLKHQVRITDMGEFIVGLGRNAPEMVVLTLTEKNRTPEKKFINIKKRDYNIQRIEGVEQSKVTPPADRLERIRAENAQIAQARQIDSSRTDFLQDFMWPAVGPITGVYGSQRFYNGLARSPHYGIDIAGPEGAPVRAPIPGIVTLVHNDMYFSGGTLIIDHGHGISSTFIHLSKILVNKGDEVFQGQTIAQIGATGRATGPHLDWRINWFDQRLDPTFFVGPMPDAEDLPKDITSH